MPQFVYQVRNNAGASETGVLTAGNTDEASHILRREGKIIVSLREESPAPPAQIHHASRNKVKRDDVIFFATQLAVMVDTGVPLAEAIDSIAVQIKHPNLKLIVQDISDQVKGGVEFSTALAQYPKVFSNLFVALMRASESSGTMGKMLLRVSDYLTQQRNTQKKIKGAMVYPFCLLGLCVLVVTGLLTFVLPRFENIFAGKGVALPLPTRILLGFSTGIITYWPIILAAILAGTVGGYLYLHSTRGRITLDLARVKLPVIGRMYRKACLARSLRTMATMVSSGVGILEGLAVTADVAGNHFFAELWKDLSEKVKEGSNLSDQMRNYQLIPPTVSQMVAAGEKTGKLAMVMDKVAFFCEEDLKVSVKALTTIIEPMMIVVMGIIVGGIAISLLLPIFSVAKVIAH